MKRLTRKLMVFPSLLAVVFLFMLLCPIQASADETTNSLLSQFEYLNVNYDDTLGFIYNDGFFFLGNNQLSPELAKVSISLASAAYDLNKNGSYEELPSVLSGLNCSYTLYNYDKSHTSDDFDWVRYAIATREVSFQGQNYIIYIVPIQGTSGSYDWFGNAKLGTGSDHEGFYIAANKVMQELSSVMSGDGYSYDTRIILTTGHSRGAAVSNIIAGKLTEGASGFISPTHVFSYNFACPSVSTNANENFQNIYNFNSGDDLVPVVPLEDWGYSRYGVTIELPYADLNNVRQRFSSYTGSEYVGTYETPIYIEDVLKRAIPNNAAANDLTEPILKGLAFCMGNANGSMKDFFSVMDIDISENRLSAFRRGFEYSEEGFQNSLDYWNDVAELIPRYLNETEPMTEEGYNGESFSAWFERNREEIEEMEAVFNYNVSSSDVSTFIQDIKAIQALVVADKIKTVTGVSVPDPTALTKLLTCGAELYIYFHNGGSFTAVGHAHMSQTYLLWINSMYFGYSGWRNNTQEQIGLTSENVLTIAPYCFTDSSIVAVSPMDSICYLASNSFYCSGLKLLDISNITINPYTFAYSGDLERVTLSGYKSIPSYAFTGCSGLQEVVLNGVEEIETGAFQYCGTKTLTIGADAQSIGSYAFSGNQNLETIYFNAKRIADVEYNDHDIFSYSGTAGEGISIIFGDTVEYIPSWLFAPGAGQYSDSTAKIVSITIGSNVKEIGSCAFYRCKDLTTVKMPASVQAIGYQAFEGCTGVKSIGPTGSGCGYEFGWTGEIPAQAFRGFTGVTHVIIPKTCILPGGEFDGCYNLVTAGPIGGNYNFEFGWTDIIPDNAFYRCYGLKNVTLPETLTVIGEHAFERASLETLVIPNSVKTIGTWAFYGCNLMSLTIGSGVETIGWYAFEGSSNLETIYYNAKRATADADEHYYGVFGNAGSSGDGVTVIFGDTVEYIPSWLFAPGAGQYSDSTAKIVSITIGSNVKEIGSCAFYRCKDLTTVKMPASVQAIGYQAFEGCSALKDIYYAGTEEMWYKLYPAWENDIPSATIYFAAVPSPDFILPAALTTIEDEAFTGGAFVYVKLPDKAVSIGWHAFADCPNLAYIYIPALTTQIDEEAFGTIHSLTILGKAGTFAETYAQNHHFTFIAVS